MPPARYYAIKLTQAAKQTLRLSFRDLYLEGYASRAFQHKEHRAKVAMTVIDETMKLYCMNLMPMSTIAKVLKASEATIRSRINIGYQIILTYIEPKPLRDELIRVARGAREPYFTRLEICKLIEEGRRG